MDAAQHARVGEGGPIRHVAFGTTAAVVTSVGLIAGFGAASAPKRALASSLLIIAIADNLSDSLSLHLEQEAERLEPRAAFRATVMNFATRLAVALSFVAAVWFLPEVAMLAVSLAWGGLLLGALSYGVARQKGVSPVREVLRHLVVALMVVLVSQLVGWWLAPGGA